MFHTLAQDVKDRLTQSIAKAFEQYMKEIEWDYNHYDPAYFKKSWWDNIKQASWYKEIDRDILENPQFKAEVNEEMGEIIEKTFKDEPTEEQEKELQDLIKKLNHPDIDYCSKAEVEYYIEKLKNL